MGITPLKWGPRELWGGGPWRGWGSLGRFGEVPGGLGTLPGGLLGILWGIWGFQELLGGF